MTGLCFTDFSHVPRPKKVLLGVREGKRRNVDQTSGLLLQSVHTQNTVLSHEHEHCTCTALVLAMPTSQNITKLNSKHTGTGWTHVRLYIHHYSNG